MPCRPAILSISLGRAWHHSLPSKLDAAARHGFEGIELFMEDLEYFARDQYGDDEPHSLKLAAADVQALCQQRGIHILCLQPFMNYEGLKDRQEHAQRMEKAKLWLDLAIILHTDIMQVPSSTLDSHLITDDRNVIVADLRDLADLAAAHDIRLVYEALCFGRYCNVWEASWEIVQQVDRPNFGICLDTFNITGGIYADPASASGTTPDAEAAVAASVERLARNVDVSKIFYVEVVDAERLASPLVAGHEFYDPQQPSRMSWSRNCRLFYGEQDRGGYLPLAGFLDAIFNRLGYEGWVSLEFFNRTMAEPDASVPEEHARRGGESWRKLARDYSLAPAPPALHSTEARL